MRSGGGGKRLPDTGCVELKNYLDGSTDLAAWIARTARIAPSGPTTARRLHGPDSSFDRAPRGSRSIRRAPIQPYRAANPATTHLATAVPSSCRLLRLCGDPAACFPNRCADRPCSSSAVNSDVIITVYVQQRRQHAARVEVGVNP